MSVPPESYAKKLSEGTLISFAIFLFLSQELHNFASDLTYFVIRN